MRHNSNPNEFANSIGSRRFFFELQGKQAGTMLLALFDPCFESAM